MSNDQANNKGQHSHLTEEERRKEGEHGRSAANHSEHKGHGEDRKRGLEQEAQNDNKQPVHDANSSKDPLKESERPSRQQWSKF